ncbi:hypothetical protein Y027_3868 [Burkholderia pseudomallei TSV5]|nr:hypothetical protein Y027_3868 [Burkholderia pseudomallei TSV5]
MRTEPGLHGEAATDDRQSITGNPQSTHRTQARKPASPQARKHASTQARKHASVPDSGNLRAIRRKT